MAKSRRRIRLWELGSGLPLGEIRDFLQDTFGPAFACPPPRRLVPEAALPALARSVLRWRILDPGRLGLPAGPPTMKEQDAMARLLAGTADPPERRGHLVSGLGLAAELARHIPANFSEGTVDLVLTGALPAMWEPSDCRYHARALVCGFPSVISTSGAVEGPARPRGYYVAKMMGLSEDEARKKYIGRFLEHGDPRLSGVAKGLAAQAVFYNLTGRPFCEHENCRLFNGRWQEQLVGAQLGSARFCEQHGRFLKGLRRP